MADKLWKQVERKVAALIGGQRVPVSGRIRGFAPDVKHDIFSIEVKHREELPSWLLDALNQADESNNGSQISVVILHEKGMKYEDCLCVMRLADVAKFAETERNYKILQENTRTPYG